MKKNQLLIRALVIGMVIMFIGASSLPGLAANVKIKNTQTKSMPLMNRDIIYVDDDNTAGPWDGTQAHPYQYIQDGIDNANAGDTIYVFNGTYTEDVYINKAVDLVGENKESVLVNSSSSSETIHLKVDHINMSGFSVTNNGQTVGILFDGVDNCTITNNIISNNTIGIRMFHSAQNTIDNNYIANNIISDNQLGIMMVNSTHNSVDNNLIKNNTCAIVMFYSTYNSISNNLVEYNSQSILIETRSNRTSLTYNTITHSSTGIYFLNNSCNNSVMHNNISDNHDGLYFETSHDNFVASNRIENNSGYGICLNSSYGSTLYYNNLINNSIQAMDECTNIWDNGYPSGGNYWDNYTGVDNFHGPNQDVPGSDGIGDTPYNISGGDNQDNYPFMNQTSGNLPPNMPSAPDGPSAAGPNVDISFSTVAVDLEGDSLYYLWDWGDGNFSEWIGPFNSSEPMATNYSWNETGIYDIRVKVKDIYELESEWSEPHNISIATQIELSNLRPGFVYFNIFTFNNSYLFSYILETIGVCVVVSLTYDLYLEATATEAVRSVTFKMVNPIFGDNITIVDDDASDGFTGFTIMDAFVWQLSAYAYDEDGVMIDVDTIELFIFLKIGKNQKAIGAVGDLRQRVIDRILNK